MDIYESETFDFKITQGDTTLLKFQFKDIGTGKARNISAYLSKFNLYDSITNEIITDLHKYHEDVAPAGKGIYYYNDTYKESNLYMTANNQLVIVLSYGDTSFLKEGIYSFDIEFSIGTSRFTVVKGNLIVTKEITISV